MKTKVLITGANGFIGSHLVEYLSRHDYEISCLIRKTSNLQWLEKSSVEFITGEITDKTSLVHAVTEKDYIFHLASLTKAISPVDYYRVNTEGAKNLLQACAMHNPALKRFVLVSSQAAAGPSPSEKAIDETFPPHPITDYGKSKWEAEKIAREYMEKIPITIIRPPAVYGPRDRDVYVQFKMVKGGWLF